MPKVEQVPTKQEEEPAQAKQDQSDQDDVAEGTAQAIGGPKPNRGQKKCRKAMQRLGLKPVPGIHRVTMKRAKNVLFTIQTPQVMKSPNAQIYVVFGAAKYQDMNQSLAQDTVNRFKTQEAPKTEQPIVETIKEQPDKEDETELDEEGLREEDIENVMSHCTVSRAQAVKALRESNNDPIDAILKFS